MISVQRNKRPTQQIAKANLVLNTKARMHAAFTFPRLTSKQTSCMPQRLAGTFRIFGPLWTKGRLRLQTRALQRVVACWRKSTIYNANLIAKKRGDTMLRLEMLTERLQRRSQEATRLSLCRHRKRVWETRRVFLVWQTVLRCSFVVSWTIPAAANRDL